jgi:hypothetical protein
MTFETPLRSFDEIQAAHDRLVQILLGEVPCPFDDPSAMRLLNMAAGVLCWVLCHDHNPTFSQNLAAIDDYLREQGYELKERVQ